MNSYLDYSEEWRGKGVTKKFELDEFPLDDDADVLAVENTDSKTNYKRKEKSYTKKHDIESIKYEIYWQWILKLMINTQLRIHKLFFDFNKLSAVFKKLIDLRLSIQRFEILLLLKLSEKSQVKFYQAK